MPVQNEGMNMIESIFRDYRYRKLHLRKLQLSIRKIDLV